MDMSLSKLWETVNDRDTQNAAVHGVAKSWTKGTEQQHAVVHGDGPPPGCLATLPAVGVDDPP